MGATGADHGGRGARARIGAVLCVCGALACQSAAETAAPRASQPAEAPAGSAAPVLHALRPEAVPPEACRDLARDFTEIAEHRDAGASKDDQVLRARQELGESYASGQDDRTRALATRLHMIDLVYRLPPGKRAPDVEAFVEAHCSVDAHGDAVLRAPWPTGEP